MTLDQRAIFLLDANVFIEAHRRYYAPDLCPGFWQCLEHHGGKPYLQSIDKVRGELERGKDTLWEWAKHTPDNLFVSSADPAVGTAYQEIMAWVHGNAQFKPEAKAKFAGEVDGWLIAYAKVHPAVLVTHEVFNAEVRKKVPIPNVCREFGVSTFDTFEMLRELKVSFDWRR